MAASRKKKPSTSTSARGGGADQTTQSVASPERGTPPERPGRPGNSARPVQAEEAPGPVREGAAQPADERPMPSATSRQLLLAGGLVAAAVGIFALVRTHRASPPIAPAADAAPTTPEGPPRQVFRRGPWGELRVNTILLQPPLEAIAAISTDCAKLSTAWFFPGWDAGKLAELGSTLFDAPTGAALQNNAACGPTGCTVIMPAAARLAMPSAARQRLYPLLGKLGNEEFSGAIKLQDENVDEWLDSALARPEDRAFVKGLFYKDGERSSFADSESVCARLSGEDARRRFIGALFASEALLVHLRVPHAQPLDPLVAYWSGGFRRLKNIEPMLRSLSLEPQGGEIDLAHILPGFARRYLYTFPPAVDEKLNCHWTTLNFAAGSVDDTVLDDAKAKEAFNTQYAEVAAADRRYGDAVTFWQPDGTLDHSAVYVADDIVYTKNGRSMRRPWALLRLDEVRAAYPKATTLRYLRRKSAFSGAN